MEGRPLTEHDLIRRAKDGDVGAFEDLVRIHQQTAIRVALLVLGDPDEAKDVTQDAFIKAYYSLARFKTERPFRPWMLRIVRNEALNRRRRRGRQQNLGLRLADDPVSGGAAPSPETAVIREIDSAVVLDAVSDLPVAHREVVAHRYLLGLSEAETASALGIPLGTVKSRTARALRRLAEALEGKIDEDQRHG